MKSSTLPHRFCASLCCLLAGALLVGSGCSEKPKDPKASLRPAIELARDVGSTDPARRRYAYRDLALHGHGAEPALPILLQQLRSNDAATRRSAAAVIGKIGPAGYKPVQAMLADSDDPTDKRGAAQAMGELGGEACAGLTDLLDAMESVYPEVRTAAAVAAGRVLRDCQAEPDDAPSTIRIKDPRLTELAQAMVGSDGAGTDVGKGFAEMRHVKPKAGEIRQSLGALGVNADQMGQLPDEELPEVEIKIGWRSKAAVKGPPKGAAQVVTVLCKLLVEDEELEVRAAAAKGLGYAGPLAQGAMAFLARGLRDQSSSVAQNCAWALGETGAKEAKALLEEYRAHAPADVRPAVDSALQNLKPK